MPELSKRERSIAAKFKKYQALKEKAKECYDRADGVLTEIARQLEGPKLIKMREQLTELTRAKHSIRIGENGQLLQLRESAADENGILGWGHGAVRQFDAKVINP